MLKLQDCLGVVEGAEVRLVLEDDVDVRRNVVLQEEGVHALAGFLRRVFRRRELVSRREGNLVLLGTEAEGVCEVCGEGTMADIIIGVINIIIIIIRVEWGITNLGDKGLLPYFSLFSPQSADLVSTPSVYSPLP